MDGVHEDRVPCWWVYVECSPSSGNLRLRVLFILSLRVREDAILYDLPHKRSLFVCSSLSSISDPRRP